jgi:hypothetical protein
LKSGVRGLQELRLDACAEVISNILIDKELNMVVVNNAQISGTSKPKVTWINVTLECDFVAKLPCDVLALIRPQIGCEFAVSGTVSIKAHGDISKCAVAGIICSHSGHFGVVEQRFNLHNLKMYEFKVFVSAIKARMVRWVLEAFDGSDSILFHFEQEAKFISAQRLSFCRINRERFHVAIITQPEV